MIPCGRQPANRPYSRTIIIISYIWYYIQQVEYVKRVKRGLENISVFLTKSG